MKIFNTYIQNIGLWLRSNFASVDIKYAYTTVVLIICRNENFMLVAFSTKITQKTPMTSASLHLSLNRKRSVYKVFFFGGGGGGGVQPPNSYTHVLHMLSTVVVIGNLWLNHLITVIVTRVENG